MSHWAWAVLLLLAVGCGKSFQEADAIYKDEVAKLASLKADYRKLMETIAKERRAFEYLERTLPADPKHAKDLPSIAANYRQHQRQWDEEEVDLSQRISEQELRVKAAFKSKDAVK